MTENFFLVRRDGMELVVEREEYDGLRHHGRFPTEEAAITYMRSVLVADQSEHFVMNGWIWL
jgi:hypothetical protein